MLALGNACYATRSAPTRQPGFFTEISEHMHLCSLLPIALQFAFIVESLPKAS
jgi:hypothetical protein